MPAAYGVKDTAGTSGKPRSAPVARSAAHPAHGSATATPTAAAGRPGAGIRHRSQRPAASGYADGAVPGSR